MSRFHLSLALHLSLLFLVLTLVACGEQQEARQEKEIDALEAAE